MNELADYVRHIRTAANDAIGFVKGMNKADFLNDQRTQNAAVMSL
jgi:uncharacterized protein with HEPN domain